jgi:hypothetical protein
MSATIPKRRIGVL